MGENQEFRIEAFCDFPDDAIEALQPITPQQIDAMMAALARLGISRVSWGYYGDGHGGLLVPASRAESKATGGAYDRLDEISAWYNYAETYAQLQNPMAVAVEAAHRHCLEIYGYYKPYETGTADSLPEGSLEAMVYGRLSHIGGRLTWLDRFVMDNPQLRIQRRSDDLPADVMTKPIHAIKLIKKDDSPTRITKEHLQIWASKMNYRYQPLTVNFEVKEAVEPSKQEVREGMTGKVITRIGDPVRTLTLHGLNLTNPYILVTTDFAEGPADFSNAGAAMIVALDSDGREIPGVTATGEAVWNQNKVDFRNYGLIFDHGWGYKEKYLDEPNANGKDGIIAYARGKNQYLTGALCETEPQVRAYWLSCIQEMLDAGVDGIDFREENHSTFTDYPQDYGYNQVVLDECRRRGSIDSETIAQVRGEAYNEFLRQAKRTINGAGKRVRINLQLDWLRKNPSWEVRLAFPANLNFDWRSWISEGLMDEAILRDTGILPLDMFFEDDTAKEMTSRCQERNIPITVNRYIQPETLLEEYRRVRDDGRFAGFILYETYSFMRFPDGKVTITMDEVNKLKQR